MKKMLRILTAFALLLPACSSTASTTTDDTAAAAETATTQTETIKTDTTSDTKTDTTSDKKTDITADTRTSSKKDTAVDKTSGATEETSSSKSSSKTSNKKPTTNSSTSSKKASGVAEDLMNKLEGKGYKIYDKDYETNEVDFDAMNNTGAIEISVKQYSSASRAQQAYAEDTNVLWDEDFSDVDEETYANGSISVLYNDFNSICGIEVVDLNNNITISIDDIPEASLDTIKAIVNDLGLNS